MGALEGALEEAAGTKDWEGVRRLLDEGADTKSLSAGNALYLVARGGALDVVELLLDRGVKVDTFEAGVAVRFAAAGGHLDIVKLLLGRGAECSTDEGSEALCDSAGGGHLEMLEFLLERGVGDVKNNQAGEALKLAAAGGRLDIVELLLDRGVDVNGRCLYFEHAGWCGLESALEAGHLGVAKVLLDRGLQVDKESQGKCDAALQATLQMGHLGLVKSLLACGVVKSLLACGAEARLLACGGDLERRLAELEEVKKLFDNRNVEMKNVEMKVSMKKGVGFYIRAAASFLKGVEARDAIDDKPAAEAKPPVDTLKISGLGDAINAAIAAAARVETDKLGVITKVETNYPDMVQGRGCAQIVINIRRPDFKG